MTAPPDTAPAQPPPPSYEQAAFAPKASSLRSEASELVSNRIGFVRENF